VWDEFQEKRSEYGLDRGIVTADSAPLSVNLLQQGTGSMRGAIGTPDQIAELLRRYEEIGVDQAIFVMQAGKNQHEHICEAIELFGKKVLPEFAERRDKREAEKRDRLAEACDRAIARRSPPRRSNPNYVITPQGEPTPAQLISAARRADDASGLRRSLKQRVSELGQAALAAFVRGRSDRQLERTIGSRPAMQAIFKGMERAFVPERAELFSGEIQYELNGGGPPRNWVIRVKDGRAEAYEGKSEDPVVTFRMSVPTFARIAAGELHPAKAMFNGDMEIGGSFEVASRMPDMFGQESLI
jgi:putative sterol carrier protein